MSRQDYLGIFTLPALFMLASIATAELVVVDEGPDTPTRSNPTISVPSPSDKSGDNKNKTDLLDFVNRDRLHGTLVSVKPGQYGLIWKHENSEKEMALSPSCVSAITLAKRPAGNKTPQNAIVRLTNDDALEGTIVSLDSNKLILDTWYSGKIEIKRPMLKMLNPNSTSATVIYEGPGDISEWTLSRGSTQASWKYKNGALYSINQYPIGKMIENMPDMVEMHFDAAWKRYPSFYFAFFTDNLQQYYGNCYMMQVGGSYVYLQRNSRDGGSSNLGRLNIESFGNNTVNKARFSLYIDKKKKAFTLQINGQTIKQWSDPGTFAGMGNGILFQSQDQGGGLKISGIKVAQWNGQVPGQPESGTATKDDTIRLVNNDKVSGHIKSIDNGNIKFETSYATMDVPLQRATDIEFAADQAERARRNKDDVKASFTEKGIITVQVTSIDKDKLSGTSENFGNISIPLGALRRIELNIYREKDSGDDDDFSF